MRQYNNNPVGISDIGVYLPKNRIDLAQIISVRSQGDAAMARRLAKGVELTGQKAIRYPDRSEDPVSMAANAVLDLLSHGSGFVFDKLRLLLAGTESTMDFSKPLSSWVGGLLQKSGFPVPHTISTAQYQHACAATTLALLSAASQLKTGGRSGETALVLASDIARYEAPSSAEITQGAGALALLVEENPRLLELDIANQGFASADVDDFFRPLNSVTARVKGQYSIQCYHDAANRAFLDYCERAELSPRQALDEHDWFVFHVPFAKMAYTAARHLLATHYPLHDGEVDQFLSTRGFFESLETTAEVGNIYSGAAYLNLASLLSNRHEVLGDKIVGKKILISSYGSGNTMVVYSARVAQSAPEVIRKWDLARKVKDAQVRNFEHYLDWIEGDRYSYPQTFDSAQVAPGEFFLESLREDGYRVYTRKS